MFYKIIFRRNQSPKTDAESNNVLVDPKNTLWPKPVGKATVLSPGLWR